MKIMSRILLLLVVVFLGCERQEKVTENEEVVRTMEGTIVAMGDSLTAGFGVNMNESYPALLEKKLHAQKHFYQVINSGVSGETSSGALSRLSWVLKLKPDIVILETGANDGLRGLSPSLIKQNIASILEQLLEQKITVVMTGMQMVANLGEEYTEEFQKIYPDLAREHKVIFMPFFLEGVAGRQDLNLADGIHPNVLGYQVVTDTIYPFVLEAVQRKKL